MQVRGRFDPANTGLTDTRLKMKLVEEERKADLFNRLDHRQPVNKFESNARNLFKQVGAQLTDKTGNDSVENAMRQGFGFVKSQGKNFQTKSENADRSAFQVLNELNIREDQRNGNAKARQERSAKGLIDDPNAYGITALGGASRSYRTQGNLSKSLGVKNVKPGQ